MIFLRETLLVGRSGFHASRDMDVRKPSHDDKGTRSGAKRARELAFQLEPEGRRATRKNTLEMLACMIGVKSSQMRPAACEEDCSGCKRSEAYSHRLRWYGNTNG